MRAVIKLSCTDVSCEWVSCLHSPVDFLEFLPGNRNHHHLSDDVEYHELQLVCHCEFCHCDVEDEDAADGSRLSVVPPSSSAIDIVIEVFSCLELLIFSLTLLMFWTYRSQRLPRFRQVSVLHFEALFSCNGKFCAVEEAFEAHQHPNGESIVWRSATVQLSFCNRSAFVAV